MTKPTIRQAFPSGELLRYLTLQETEKAKKALIEHARSLAVWIAAKEGTVTADDVHEALMNEYGPGYFKEHPVVFRFIGRCLSCGEQGWKLYAIVCDHLAR